MKYILSRRYPNKIFTNKLMIEDLQKAGKKVKHGWLTMNRYNKRGKFSPETISKRFGGWHIALRKAGLKTGNNIFIPDTELLKNLKRLWDSLGRAPHKTEMKKPLSRYSISTYIRRFGSFYDALKIFTKVYKNGVYNEKAYHPVKKLRAARIREGMRVKVLIRDKFRCKYCGASPFDDPKVKLHVDHIIPLSKGGLSAMQNLQTLCSKCNLGKAVKIIKK